MPKFHPCRRALPTLRQTLMLRVIHGYTGSTGFPPSVRECGRMAGIGSTNGVIENQAALEKKGFLTKVPGISRGVVVTPAGVSWLSEVSDG